MAGTTLIDGTEYTISGGSTMIDGTGYDINFKKACTISITASITTSAPTRAYMVAAGVAYCYSTVPQPTYTVEMKSGDIITIYAVKRACMLTINGTATTIAIGGSFDYTVNTNATITMGQYNCTIVES